MNERKVSDQRPSPKVKRVLSQHTQLLLTGDRNLFDIGDPKPSIYEPDLENHFLIIVVHSPPPRVLCRRMFRFSRSVAWWIGGSKPISAPVLFGDAPNQILSLNFLKVIVYSLPMYPPFFVRLTPKPDLFRINFIDIVSGLYESSPSKPFQSVFDLFLHSHPSNKPNNSIHSSIHLSQIMSSCTTSPKWIATGQWLSPSNR